MATCLVEAFGLDSTPLQDYLQQLASEGVADSSGFFTLSANKVAERYRTLLEQNPALPWLRWMQFSYGLRARRYLAQMLREEHRLSLTGLPCTEALQRALCAYPEPIGGQAGLLQEVLWLFLAQNPEKIVLELRTAQGCLTLTIGPESFERSQSLESPEEDLRLRVFPSGGWMSWLTNLAQRLSIQSIVSQRSSFFPALLEWDGGLEPRRLDVEKFPQRRKVVLAHLVSQEQSAKIPHFACSQPLFHRPQTLGLNAERSLELPGDFDECDCYGLHWGGDLEGELCQDIDLGLSLQKLAPHEFRLSKSQQFVLPRERMRTRLLLVYCQTSKPAWFLPVVDGVSLDPIPLKGWPDGVALFAACPPDMKTDFSGLQLVDNEHLHDWLQHLRQSYARTILRWVHQFPVSSPALAYLGDCFSAASDAG